MTLPLFWLLGIWIAAIGCTIFLARDRLDSPSTSWKDELLVRCVALLASTIALSIVALASLIITKEPKTVIIAIALWGVSIFPLILPRKARQIGKLVISSTTCISLSIGLAALGALSVSLFVLVLLILSNPELVSIPTGDIFSLRM